MTWAHYHSPICYCLQVIWALALKSELQRYFPPEKEITWLTKLILHGFKILPEIILLESFILLLHEKEKMPNSIGPLSFSGTLCFQGSNGFQHAKHICLPAFRLPFPTSWPFWWDSRKQIEDCTDLPENSIYTEFEGKPFVLKHKELHVHSSLSG